MATLSKYIALLALGAFSLNSMGQSGSNYVISQKIIGDNDTISSEIFFDGLGRQQLSVERCNSALLPAAVSLVEYDKNGRDSVHWSSAPIEQNSSYSYIIDNFKSRARDFYGDPCPFTVSSYDNPFVDRFNFTMGQGQQWFQANRRKVTKKQVNSSGKYNCLKLDLLQSNGRGVYSNGNQPIGIIDVESFADEDGHEEISFKDSFGQLILTRKVLDENTYADTYFIYDTQGNLTYVLPPEASKNLTPHGCQWNESDENMMKYAYFYHYDDKNRCIEKKLPGCSPVYYVYDKTGNLVFSQNGNQRGKNKWSFQILDQFGRIASSGEIVNNSSRLQLINATKYLIPRASYNRNSWEDDANALAGVSSSDINESYFYDSYYFLNTQLDSLKYKYVDGYDPKFTSSADACHMRGKMTGKVTRVLDQTNTRLVQSFYYDHHGNVIQTHEQNLMGGYEHYYYHLSVTGKPLEVRHEHTTSDTIIVETLRYTYDNMERLTATYLTRGGESEKLLCNNIYDALGRLVTATMNDGGNVTNYSYNVRGWTREVINNHLYQWLHYEDAPSGGTACYNGNIGGITWLQRESQQSATSTENVYRFGYDGLNRLVSASYSSSSDDWNGNLLTLNDRNFSCSYSYDLNGNMTSLQRYGVNYYNTSLPTHVRNHAIIDDLTMEYNGNQLKKVTDQCDDLTYEGAMDFKDGTQNTTEYTYDANGNMTSDRNKGIHSITYNILNLPQSVIFDDGHEMRYTYAADGRKLKVEYLLNNIRFIEDITPIGPPFGGGINPLSLDDEIELPVDSASISVTPLIQTLTVRDYCGNMEYLNGEFDRSYNDYGYWKEGSYYFYVKDYQGNVRVVLNSSNVPVEVNNYYPYGMLMAAHSVENQQPRKYGTKELDRENGLDWNDSQARMLMSDLGRTTTMDPLAEKYYGISPYAWCANNPVNIVDPDGMQWKYTIYTDKKGIKHVRFHLTGVVINTSSKTFSMKLVKNIISNQIKDAFNFKVDNLEVSLSTDIRIVSSIDEISEKDHVFNIVDQSSLQSNVAANTKGLHIKIGDQTMREALDGINIRTIAHEVGHSGGLKDTNLSRETPVNMNTNLMTQLQYLQRNKVVNPKHQRSLTSGQIDIMLHRINEKNKQSAIRYNYVPDGCFRVVFIDAIPCIKYKPVKVLR